MVGSTPSELSGWSTVNNAPHLAGTCTGLSTHLRGNFTPGEAGTPKGVELLPSHGQCASTRPGLRCGRTVVAATPDSRGLLRRYWLRISDRARRRRTRQPAAGHVDRSHSDRAQRHSRAAGGVTLHVDLAHVPGARTCLGQLYSGHTEGSGRPPRPTATRAAASRRGRRGYSPTSRSHHPDAASSIRFATSERSLNASTSETITNPCGRGTFLTPLGCRFRGTR